MSVSSQTALLLRTTAFWTRSIALIQWIDRWTDRTGHLVMLTFIPMILGAVYEVIARYVFNSPTSWSTDVTFMANGTMFMLGGAYALMKGAHVRTDIFWDKFSERTKGRIDLITYLLFFLPTMALIFAISFGDALRAFDIQERSNAGLWQPILWPFRAVIPLTALLLFMQGLSEGLKSYWAVLTNEPYITHEKIEI
ncbi:MAG: TRAP transporter small permease subunit [Betaproteobacteria bacterium]|jgi:TRAP-type mannitol/chloroaromatic compound transport system permease small subunit|nr:TRAP transporter small permease subunit [Betaproteobacteria bacterium]